MHDMVLVAEWAIQLASGKWDQELCLCRTELILAVSSMNPKLAKIWPNSKASGTFVTTYLRKGKKMFTEDVRQSKKCEVNNASGTKDKEKEEEKSFPCRPL